MQYLVLERHDDRRTAIAKGARCQPRAARARLTGTERRTRKCDARSTLHTPRCLQAVSGGAELAGSKRSSQSPQRITISREVRQVSRTPLPILAGDSGDDASRPETDGRAAESRNPPKSCPSNVAPLVSLGGNRSGCSRRDGRCDWERVGAYRQRSPSRTAAARVCAM